MGLPALDLSYLTPEAYLELEETSHEKHEYQDGERFAMAGASDAHATIALNAGAILRRPVRARGCNVFLNDMKVRVDAVNAYYYPDLLVTCDPRDKQSTHAKAHPSLIIEVLSNSTQGFDRGAKFFNYQTIESFQEYVLISQDVMRVERFFRQGPNRWTLEILGEGDILHLESLDLKIPLSDLYEDVEFPSEADAEAKPQGAAS